MKGVHLSSPLSEEDARKLKLGEILYISGLIYTGRDEVHMRALRYDKEGRKLPVDLRNSVLYHCGPVMRKLEDRWEVVAAGPTTSSRMNTLEPEFIEKFGIRAIVGKGGMSGATVKAMKKFGCVYLAFPGGAAVLAAGGLREVLGVHWLDLGMPEAIWIMKAERFGPLTVAIDSHGNSLYESVERAVQEKIPQTRKALGLD